VGASQVRRSALFSNVRVGDGCRIEEAVILPQIALSVAVDVMTVQSLRSAFRPAYSERNEAISDGFPSDICPVAACDGEIDRAFG
jgi:hypothetical protein